MDPGDDRKSAWTAVSGTIPFRRGKTPATIWLVKLIALPPARLRPYGQILHFLPARTLTNFLCHSRYPRLIHPLPAPEPVGAVAPAPPTAAEAQPTATEAPEDTEAKATDTPAPADLCLMSPTSARTSPLHQLHQLHQLRRLLPPLRLRSLLLPHLLQRLPPLLPLLRLVLNPPQLLLPRPPLKRRQRNRDAPIEFRRLQA